MNTAQYFYRNAIFSKQGKTISLIDIKNPENEYVKLDPWFGMVLQLADGKHTIAELHQYMASQYNGNPPDNLTETLNSVIERLIESKLIVLTENKTELPYYLSMPYEMLDLDKAEELLKQHAEERKKVN